MDTTIAVINEARKKNMAPSVPPGVTVETTRVQWGPPVEGSAREILRSFGQSTTAKGMSKCR